jgi:hypothetical protein
MQRAITVTVTAAHKEPRVVCNVAIVQCTRYPPKYHPGIAQVSHKYRLSITQILHEKWT